MNEVVKYNNALNELSFKNFTDYDLNFLMVICAKMKELGEETQVFEYDKIMELLEWDKTKSLEIFHKDLKRMTDKLRQIGATIDINPRKFVSFNLFNKFEGDMDRRTLTIKINPDFKYILNELTSNFTRFELKEYVQLEGKYTKLIYQHLKQYRKQGWWQITIEDIRRELAIPDSMPTMNITSKIITPSIKIIKTCKGFAELECEPIKSRRRGSKIEGYKFTWTPENQIKGQMHIDDIIGRPDLTDQGQPKKRRGRPKKNAFNNIEQREYDFEAIEKKLLESK